MVLSCLNLYQHFSHHSFLFSYPLCTQVVDLPVAIFEAYENFSLCYVALGRRVDAPCTKTAGYKRHKESNFKEARPILNDINADSDSDSSSSGSSSSSSSSSSRSKSKTKSKTNNKKRSSKSENSKDSKKSKSASESDTDSDDENDGDTFGVSCASVEKEVVVGCLECKLFKVSYVMINGDAKSKEYHEPLTQFFQDFKCITVVLCANLKPNAGGEEQIIFLYFLRVCFSSTFCFLSN